MEALSVAAGVNAVVALASDAQTRGVISKSLHKIYKRIFLKKVYCVVCEDYTRIQLNLEVNDDKYIVVNLEEILKSMSSDAENARFQNLKCESIDLYILTVAPQLKHLLNIMRNSHSDKHVIALLSNKKLAKALHIKDENIQCYCMDDFLLNEILTKVPEKHRNYILHQNKMNAPFKFKYSSVQQLKDHLQSQYEN